LIWPVRLAESLQVSRLPTAFRYFHKLDNFHTSHTYHRWTVQMGTAHHIVTKTLNNVRLTCMDMVLSPQSWNEHPCYTDTGQSDTGLESGVSSSPPTTCHIWISNLPPPGIIGLACCVLQPQGHIRASPDTISPLTNLQNDL